VGLYLWLYPEFLDLVISEYGHPVDEGFRMRIRFRARVAALWEYGSGLDLSSPGDAATLRRYVAQAFPRS